MKNDSALLFLLCLTGAGLTLLPGAARAFSCVSNGVPASGAGTSTIPVDVTLSRNAPEIILSDLSTYTTCSGLQGNNEALRTTGVTLSPLLTGSGYRGFIDIAGARYPVPAAQVCVWPDGACSANYPDNVAMPVPLKIGMERLSTAGANGLSLPAGTEIARITTEQRSGEVWGQDRTWSLTLKSPLVIPAYTCTVDNPDLTVRLPPVTRSELMDNGAGRYPVATPFSISLTCDPQTTVSVSLEGATLPGTDSVLADSSGGTEGVGIQLLSGGAPVPAGQMIQVISNSQARETLPYHAHYYYAGGNIRPGTLSAVATFSFTYN
ncbi:fimbrial protein [Enterobacter bugandensis]|nr:fimbrial protein [Enterobacter bugandensis]